MIHLLAKNIVSKKRRAAFDRFRWQGLSVVALVLVLAPAFATPPANVYYVSTEGSNTNSGLSPDDAFRTIREGWTQLKPGDTLFVLPGTYQEGFYSPPGGSSWEFPVAVRAFDPNDRPVLQPEPGTHRVITFASSTSSYIEIDGFVMDARNVSYDAIKITWGTYEGASHHIRIRNSEIRNAPTNGILVSGHSHGVSHNEFIDVDIHHNGVTDLHHGVYTTCPNSEVVSCEIHDNAGWGISSYSGDGSQSIFRNNIVQNNAAAGNRGAGIGVYNGDNILVFNNWIAENQMGIEIAYGDVAFCQIYRNNVRGNDVAFRIGGPTVTEANVVGNKFMFNTDNRIQDYGTDTYLDHNLVKPDED